MVKGERETILQAKSNEHKARREIYQCLTGVAGQDNLAVPTVIVSDIDLHLRPKVFEDFVLKRVIRQQSVSDDRHVSGRQAPNVPMFRGRRNFRSPFRRRSWV
jgi:hypothetical protein